MKPKIFCSRNSGYFNANFIENIELVEDITLLRNNEVARIFISDSGGNDQEVAFYMVDKFTLMNLIGYLDWDDSARDHIFNRLKAVEELMEECCVV